MSPFVCVVLLFILGNIIFIIDYIKRNSDNDKLYQKGLYDPPCPKVESQEYMRIIYDDWNHEKKLFSNKYIEYLEYSSAALEDYKMCLLWEMQRQNGYIPDYIPNGYNKNYYVATTYFIEKYRFDIVSFYKNREDRIG